MNGNIGRGNAKGGAHNGDGVAKVSSEQRGGNGLPFVVVEVTVEWGVVEVADAID